MSSLTPQTKSFFRKH